MDDIDVTSSMGKNLPCVFNVVEATTMLGFDRNFARTQVPGSGGVGGRRGIQIGWSLRVLRDELIKRFGTCCVARSLAPVGENAAPRPEADRAGVRGGAWRRPGIRRGGNTYAGRAGSARLVPPPYQIPRLLKV